MRLGKNRLLIWIKCFLSFQGDLLTGAYVTYAVDKKTCGTIKVYKTGNYWLRKRVMGIEPT